MPRRLETTDYWPRGSRRNCSDLTSDAPRFDSSRGYPAKENPSLPYPTPSKEVSIEELCTWRVL